MQKLLDMSLKLVTRGFCATKKWYKSNCFLNLLEGLWGKINCAIMPASLLEKIKKCFLLLVTINNT